MEPIYSIEEFFELCKIRKYMRSGFVDHMSARIDEKYPLNVWFDKYQECWGVSLHPKINLSIASFENPTDESEKLLLGENDSDVGKENLADRVSGDSEGFRPPVLPPSPEALVPKPKKKL